MNSKRFLMAVTLLFVLVSSVGVAATNSELNHRMDILTEQMATLQSQSGRSKTNIGGYGEFVYENYRTELEDGTLQGKNPKIDAKRFILYISHEFAPRWSLTSEIEVEHVNQIFLEQGTIDYKFSDKTTFHVGLMLVPVGFINIYHEPTTFLSVNRPEIASKIIPTTWREVGVSVNGQQGDFEYRMALINGLQASSFNSGGVRGGRQKGATANGRPLAWVGRLDYKFLEGSAVIGGSAYVGKAGGTQTDVDHRVFDLHYDGQFAGFHTRALYTTLTLSNIDKLNAELGENIGEEMNGYYGEVGYNVLHKIADWKLTPFVRFEKFNTHAKVAAGQVKDSSKDKTNITYGVTAKPVDNVVFKLDYLVAKNKQNTGSDTWGMAVGWNF